MHWETVTLLLLYLSNEGSKLGFPAILLVYSISVSKAGFELFLEMHFGLCTLLINGLR